MRPNLLGACFFSAAYAACLWMSCGLALARFDGGPRFAPPPMSILGNKGVEADARGRLGFWNAEKERTSIFGTELKGESNGSHSFDREVIREGKSSVLLKPKPGCWYGIGSINYPLPAWSDRIRISGWVRCSPGASAGIRANWINAEQKVISFDGNVRSNRAEWTHLQYETKAPRNSVAVRLVAHGADGPAWFDELDLQILTPNVPVVRVFVNQVGYDARSPKSAVVAANFRPATSEVANVSIVDRASKVVLRKNVASPRRIHRGTKDDWGWYFWRADFSELTQPGHFRVQATIGSGKDASVAESPAFQIGAQILFDETVSRGVDFFFVQRCGFEVPGWHKACHLDDAKLPDGTHVDATGGWHSAGDYNKPMWQMGDSAAVYALAAIYDERTERLSKRVRGTARMPAALDEAHWGAKFLAKMQNPADGSLRGDVNQGPRREWMKWTAPDVHTDNRIGTADDPVIAQPVGNAPLAIAGLARTGKLLNDRGIANDYIDRAKRLWDFHARQSSAAGNSLLLLSALDMDAITGDQKYRSFADLAASALVASQRENGSYLGDSGDHGDWAAAALASYALRFPNDRQQTQVRASLIKYLSYCLAVADNPFGLSPQGRAANGPVFFQQSTGLGVNFWLLGRAWAAALIHRLTGDRRALEYAVDQVDWVFGKNPLGLCMFEGVGELNPPRYHHRYNQIAGQPRGAVPGAIANGFVTEMGMADRAGFDMSRVGGRSPSFRTSEPWLVHNVMHLLAVNALTGPSSDR